MARYLVLAPCQSSNVSDVIWASGSMVDIMDADYGWELWCNGKVAPITEIDPMGAIAILNLLATPQGRQCVITWQTDIPCDSQLQWGITTEYGNFYRDKANVTDHEVVFGNIQPGTVTHFRVICATQDARAVSADQYVTQVFLETRPA